MWCVLGSGLSNAITCIIVVDPSAGCAWILLWEWPNCAHSLGNQQIRKPFGRKLRNKASDTCLSRCIKKIWSHARGFTITYTGQVQGDRATSSSSTKMLVKSPTLTPWPRALYKNGRQDTKHTVSSWKQPYWTELSYKTIWFYSGSSHFPPHVPRSIRGPL